jgi:hypothetical protein
MALINRYQGNSGHPVRYAEPGDRRHNERPEPPQHHQMQQEPQSLLGELGKALPERIGELETEDIILLLILYLMYRESGDSELLIIMGGMFLL